MKKEEKQRLQEQDRFMRFMSSFWAGVKARAQRVTMVVALLVVIALVIVIGAAAREYRADVTASAVDLARTIPDMQTALKAHPDAADLLLKLGNAYLERAGKDDPDLAAALFARAADSASDPLDRAVAQLALGKVRMDQRRYEDALKLFDQAAAEPQALSIIGNEAKWCAARCAELLGRRGEAQKRYSGIPEGQADLWRALAEYRLTKMDQEALD